MSDTELALIRRLFYFDDQARHCEEGVELYCSPEEKSFVKNLISKECAYIEWSSTKGTGESCMRFHGFTDRGRQAYRGFTPIKVQVPEQHAEGVKVTERQS